MSRCVFLLLAYLMAAVIGCSLGWGLEWLQEHGYLGEDEEDTP